METVAHTASHNQTVTMPRKREPEEIVDDTAWLISGGLADFLLLHSNEIKYMAMLGYTYLHGCKLWSKLPPDSSTSFKFISMIFQCTGGGTLVPIFINAVPVALATDAYPIAIAISFLLHMYAPILREVVEQSGILKTALIVLYETMRASVVTKLTKAAGAAIAPSEFDFAVFGPIFCGAIGGCGGAFLPLNKGLDPIMKSGLVQPMYTAFAGAMFFHLFLSTSLSDGVVEAAKKAQVVVAIFFITHHLYTAFPPSSFKSSTPEKKPVSTRKKKN